MRLKQYFRELSFFAGFARNTTSHDEKIISALGGFTGITLVAWLTHQFALWGLIDTPSSYLLVASMGASAVLLFAVPHGALSQPWPVFGGHIVSAFVGITILKTCGDSSWAAGLAVGLAIGSMYYLRCIHPPGGATALTAIIGGPVIADLGYMYVWLPIAINSVIILLVAIAFNWAFKWRRYPAHLAYKMNQRKHVATHVSEFELTQEDFAAAMRELDSYVDITTESLTDLLDLATQHAVRHSTHPEEIIAGRIYSNGKLGKGWSIRQVIDTSPNYTHPRKDKVIFKVLAGDGSFDTGICLRSEFKQWARFEVVQEANQWIAITNPTDETPT